MTNLKVRPADSRFSSGPCRKHPGWKITPRMIQNLGRSHRSNSCLEQLEKTISRMAKLLELPDDWKCGIVPGSGTGAVSIALQNLLGPRTVDTFISDGFSKHWAREIEFLKLAPQRIHTAEFGMFPDTEQVNTENDIVLVLNGTNSGVVPANLNWIPDNRKGLVIADAVSAAFTMNIDYSKIDVICWSWQKALGGEGGHGMIAFSPRVIDRLASKSTPRVSKLMRLHELGGSLNHRLFSGYTISTPSMFAVADINSALDWAQSLGGLGSLVNRVQENHQILNTWVAKTPWIEWVSRDSSYRSACSNCLRIVDNFGSLTDPIKSKKRANKIVALLESEGAAFDISSYGDAPPGFRIWAGPTVEKTDLSTLCECLEWAYERYRAEQRNFGQCV